jgi:hypothetical protein
MSAALKTRPQPREAAPAPPPQATPPARLEASAQVLDFEPGLYSVEILSAETTRAREGLVLPCLKLDPITPFLPGAGRAFIAALSEGATLAPGAHPTYVRAEGGKASVLLTIYKVAGARTAPELRVRMIGGVAEQPAARQEEAGLPSVKLTVMAHIERTGDVTGEGGHWIGTPGSAAPIEGFSIMPQGRDLRPEDIEYQAVLGTDWNTPWMRGGQFCGSRGMSLPLLGLRVRLVGKAANMFRCSIWASFVGEGEMGPIAGGHLVAKDGVPLEALRLVVDLANNAEVLRPKLVATANSQPARGTRKSMAPIPVAIKRDPKLPAPISKAPRSKSGSNRLRERN